MVSTPFRCAPLRDTPPRSKKEVKNPSVSALILPAVYLVALLVVTIPVLTTSASLAGVGVVILTQPWSIFFTSIADSFGGELLDSTWVVTTMVLVSAALNVFALYFVSFWFLRKNEVK